MGGLNGNGEERGVRNEIWGGTYSTKGHLMCKMEANYSRSLLNIFLHEKISKWNQNRRGDKAPTEPLVTE